MINDSDVSAIQVLIKWFSETPYGYVMFIFLFLLWTCKDSIKAFPKFIANLLYNYSGKKKVKNYTIRDCIEHPLFVGIDFWLETGLYALSYNNSYVLLYSMTDHKEPNPYLQAKEEMAKEVLKIKNRTVGDAFRKLVHMPELETYTPEQILVIIKDIIEKINYDQQKQYMDADLPKIFLSKFLMYDRGVVDYFKKTIEQYFNEELFVGVNVATRIYLALTAIGSYMSALNNSMFETIVSINGDLNGIEWKGKKISSNL